MNNQASDHLDFSGFPSDVRDTLVGVLIGALHHKKLPADLSGLAIAELVKTGAVSALKIEKRTVPQTLFDIMLPDNHSTNYFRRENLLGKHPFAACLMSLAAFSNRHARIYDYSSLGIAICLTIRGRDLKSFGPAISKFFEQFRLLQEKTDVETINLLPRLSFDLNRDKTAVDDAIKANVEGLSNRLEPMRALINYFLELRKAPNLSSNKPTILGVYAEKLSDFRTITISQEVIGGAPKYTGVSTYEFAHDQPQATLYANVAEADGEEDLSACLELMVKKDVNMTNALLRRQVHSGADARQRPMELIKLVLEGAFRKLNGVDDISKLLSSNSRDLRTLTKLETIFQIVCSLLTDRPLSWCRDAVLTAVKEQAKNGHLYKEDQQYFLVYQPEIKSKALSRKRIGRDKVKLEGILKVLETDGFFMKLPDVLNKFCFNYFTFIRPHLNKVGRDDKVSINSVLGELTPLRYRSLKSENIQNFLRRWLISEGTDTVVTAYLCGDGVGMCAGLHYTQLTSVSIQSVYNQFLKKMGLKTSGRTHFSGSIVGSVLVPTDEFIIGRFSELQKALCNYSHMRLSTTEFHYHNYYTLYTYTLLNMYAGYRAVGCPFEAINDFVPERDRLLVSDEDVGNTLQPRLVAIGHTGAQQLKKYIDYLYFWEKKASVFSPEIANLVEKSLRGKAPLFFLKNEKGALVNLDPSNLRPYRKFINPLPTNWQRHWLRTELTSKVFGEDIDNFMGHTAYSRNPANINSGANLNYVSDIAECVDKKLKIYEVKAL